MKYLLSALKEHWQVYVGLFLGLIIGLLVGVGFVDWNALVKGAESKITDWIMAGCTVGVLFGTWKAASYAKKAAHQAQIQNNNAIVSKIDDLYKDLGKFFEKSEKYINDINNRCESLEVKGGMFQKVILDGINEKLSEFLNLNSDDVLYKYRFFIEYVIGYKKIDKFNSIIDDIKSNRNTLVQSNIYDLKTHLDTYSELMGDLFKKITDKYQELNGSS